MKNYKEMANSVLERSNKMIEEKARKRKQVTQTLTSLCFICFVAFVGISIYQNDTFNNDFIMNNEHENINSAMNDHHDDIRKWVLEKNPIIHTIENVKYDDPTLYYYETWNSSQMMIYLGIDLSQYKNCINNEFKVIFTNDGKIVYDTAHYCFNDAIYVSVSKIDGGFDYIYELESNYPTVFKFENGDLFEVMVGVSPDGIINADFEVNGLYYRVTAKDNHENELIQVIQNILKLSNSKTVA